MACDVEVEGEEEGEVEEVTEVAEVEIGIKDMMAVVKEDVEAGVVGVVGVVVPEVTAQGPM